MLDNTIIHTTSWVLRWVNPIALAFAVDPRVVDIVVGGGKMRLGGGATGDERHRVLIRGWTEQIRGVICYNFETVSNPAEEVSLYT